MEQAQTAKHYHLVTGEVIFSHGDEVSAVRVNGILADDDNRIPVRLLAKAQQILQMNFFKKNGEEDLSKIKIIDVIMLNFSYLGHFLPTDFHKEPEGTKLQERSSDEPAVSGPSLVKGVTLEDAVAEAKQN